MNRILGFFQRALSKKPATPANVTLHNARPAARVALCALAMPPTPIGFMGLHRRRRNFIRAPATASGYEYFPSVNSATNGEMRIIVKPKRGTWNRTHRGHYRGKLTGRLVYNQ